MDENRKIEYYDGIPADIKEMSLEEIEAELEKLMNE